MEIYNNVCINDERKNKNAFRRPVVDLLYRYTSLTLFIDFTHTIIINNFLDKIFRKYG